MLTIEYAKNPKYQTEDQSVIELLVKFVEIPDELPFGATRNDVMAYGVELYERAIAGDFGIIAPYTAPIATLNQAVTSGAQTL